MVVTGPCDNRKNIWACNSQRIGAVCKLKIPAGRINMYEIRTDIITKTVNRSYAYDGFGNQVYINSIRSGTCRLMDVVIVCIYESVCAVHGYRIRVEHSSIPNMFKT